MTEAVSPAKVGMTVDLVPAKARMIVGGQPGIARMCATGVWCCLAVSGDLFAKRFLPCLLWLWTGGCAVDGLGGVIRAEASVNLAALLEGIVRLSVSFPLSL